MNRQATPIIDGAVTIEVIRQTYQGMSSWELRQVMLEKMVEVGPCGQGHPSAKRSSCDELMAAVAEWRRRGCH